MKLLLHCILNVTDIQPNHIWLFFFSVSCILIQVFRLKTEG